MTTRGHAAGPDTAPERGHVCACVVTLPPADVSEVCREIGNRILFNGLDGNPWAAGFAAQRIEGWLLDHADRIGAPAIRELARRLDPAQPREGSST